MSAIWAVPRARSKRRLWILEMIMELRRGFLGPRMLVKGRTLIWRRLAEKSDKVNRRKVRLKTSFRHFYPKNVKSAKNSTAWIALTNAQNARKKRASCVWIIIVTWKPQSNITNVPIANLIPLNNFDKKLINIWKTQLIKFCTIFRINYCFNICFII